MPTVGRQNGVLLTLTSLFIFCLVGGLTGFVATKMTYHRALGMAGNVLVGMLGAFIGGYVLSLLGADVGGVLSGTATALLGAIVLLVLVSLLPHRSVSS
jgi:uncharacterized membrane protein YeaQ/YmgE (transglycosylase-associated protein family)